MARRQFLRTVAAQVDACVSAALSSRSPAPPQKTTGPAIRGHPWQEECANAICRAIEDEVISNGLQDWLSAFPEAPLSTADVSAFRKIVGKLKPDHFLEKVAHVAFAASNNMTENSPEAMANWFAAPPEVMVLFRILALMAARTFDTLHPAGQHGRQRTPSAAHYFEIHTMKLDIQLFSFNSLEKAASFARPLKPPEDRDITGAYKQVPTSNNPSGGVRIAAIQPTLGRLMEIRRPQSVFEVLKQEQRVRNLMGGSGCSPGAYNASAKSTTFRDKTDATDNAEDIEAILSEQDTGDFEVDSTHGIRSAPRVEDGLSLFDGWVASGDRTAAAHFVGLKRSGLQIPDDRADIKNLTVGFEWATSMIVRLQTWFRTVVKAPVDDRFLSSHSEGQVEDLAAAESYHLDHAAGCSRTYPLLSHGPADGRSRRNVPSQTTNLNIASNGSTEAVVAKPGGLFTSPPPLADVALHIQVQWRRHAFERTSLERVDAEFDFGAAVSKKIVARKLCRIGHRRVRSPTTAFGVSSASPPRYFVRQAFGPHTLAQSRFTINTRPTLLDGAFGVAGRWIGGLFGASPRSLGHHSPHPSRPPKYVGVPASTIFAFESGHEQQRRFFQLYKEDPLLVDDAIGARGFCVTTPVACDSVLNIFGTGLDTERHAMYGVLSCKLVLVSKCDVLSCSPFVVSLTLTLIYVMCFDAIASYQRRRCVSTVDGDKSSNLELDTAATMPSFKTVNGVAVETKTSPQMCTDTGQVVYRSGDATVPYASLRWPCTWQRSRYWRAQRRAMLNTNFKGTLFARSLAPSPAEERACIVTTLEVPGLEHRGMLDSPQLKRVLTELLAPTIQVCILRLFRNIRHGLINGFYVLFVSVFAKQFTIRSVLESL